MTSNVAIGIEAALCTSRCPFESKCGINTINGGRSARARSQLYRVPGAVAWAQTRPLAGQSSQTGACCSGADHGALQLVSQDDTDVFGGCRRGRLLTQPLRDIASGSKHEIFSKCPCAGESATTAQISSKFLRYAPLPKYRKKIRETLAQGKLARSSVGARSVGRSLPTDRPSFSGQS